MSSLVPDDHILKQVDKVLDLSWLRGKGKDLYCMSNGRPGIDPEAVVRLFFAGYTEKIIIWSHLYFSAKKATFLTAPQPTILFLTILNYLALLFRNIFLTV
ncbi:MAG: hypothetical protein JXD22_05910 [Sedimentisphaerales bacterium]|nr:hypothetical protein [Sedimentisphaerales bacterium]